MSTASKVNMMSTMRAPRQAGFSLVELMVSVVIGLLALSFATRMVGQSEKNKQNSLGGSDAMQNGMVAMFSISSDSAEAGWGLNDPILAGCDTNFSDSAGYALSEASRGGATIHPLAAAIIVDNGAAPDQITLYAGSALSGTGSLRLVADFAGGTRIDVDRIPYGFAQDDVIVVAPETVGAAKCGLAQISNDPAAVPGPPQPQYLEINSGGRRFNGAGLGATYKASQARLFNLGPARQLQFHTWSVDSGFLRLRSTNLSGASAAPATVVDNIVSIKAQYGFDTRPGNSFTPGVAAQVGTWSASMIDADGDGVAGGAGDFQHVVALRLAVVARGKAPERPAPGASCSATTAKPVLFASSVPQGVAGVPVTVDVGVAGDSVDWRCYRYRVFETIVPLRNAAWRPTAL